MDGDSEWEAAIDRLYDAVGDSARLADALASLRPAFDARGVAFLSIPDSARPQTFHVAAAGIPEHSLVEYHVHFCLHDEWVRAATARRDFGRGAVYRGGELIPAAALRQTYFWRHFLVRHHVADVLSCVIEISTTDGPSTFITFHRHADQTSYTAADVQRLKALAPHLQRALRLHRRIAPALALGATLRDLVERSETPLLFVAADGSLAEANPAAQCALGDADGCLRLCDGRLEARRAWGWDALSSVLAALHAQPEPAAELMLHAPSGRATLLEVRRVGAPCRDPSALHAVAAVCSLRRPPRDEAALRVEHGLTTAEAQVAVQLARGLSTAQVAAAMGVRISTVRTHIRNALAKTGAARQAQLVAMVLAG